MCWHASVVEGGMGGDERGHRDGERVLVYVDYVFV